MSKWFIFFCCGIEEISKVLECKTDDDYRMMAQEVCKRFFSDHKKDVKEAGEDFDPAPWAYYLTFYLCSMSPKYFSIAYEGDDFHGGAHGNAIFGGFSVLRENGHVLTWEDYSNSPSKLVTFIEAGFGEYKEIIMSSIIENGSKLKTPDAAPWIEREALIFQYATDEIGFNIIGGPRSKVMIKEYSSMITDEMVKPLILDLINTYDKAYDIDYESMFEIDSSDETEIDEDEISTPMYSTFAGNFTVYGTPNIENFVKAIPTLYNKDYGWFIEPEIDNANGFFHTYEEGDGHFDLYGAYWNRKDGRKLFILSYDVANFYTHKGHRESFCVDGDSKFYYISSNLLYSPEEEAFLDFDTGFVAYLYNPKTNKLECMPEPPFNGWSVNTSNRFLELPKKGKNIKVREGVVVRDTDTYSYHTLKWNGMTFDYIK